MIRWIYSQVFEMFTKFDNSQFNCSRNIAARASYFMFDAKALFLWPTLYNRKCKSRNYISQLATGGKQYKTFTAQPDNKIAARQLLQLCTNIKKVSRSTSTKT